MNMTELGRSVGLSGQCFPVRSLTRNNALDSGNIGGAWLVAYKAEQRRRFKAVLCREPDVALSGKRSGSKQSSKARKSGDETRRKLDGIYLMNAHFLNDPLDLCSINISGKGLTLVNEDDFSMFKNVIHIDAGDNNLQLLNFRSFPSLKTLELPLNNISGTVVLEEKDFIWLETLDLSCNHLTTSDVLALSVLPALKVLHLTGNQLNELPQEMCRSFPLKKGERYSRFGSLEKLWLDQNNLTEMNTFTCLAGLKRLKYLNLEHNNITSVPHLRIFEGKAKPQAVSSVNCSTAEISTSNINDVIDGEIEHVNSKISILEEILYSGKTEGMTEENDVMEVEPGNCSQEHLQDRNILPFPSLRHLNVANNEIEAQEGLLTLSTWPRLEEVVIWGNPVATCGKGGPPVVNYQLGLVAGIEITRHKPASKKAKDTTSLALVAPPRKVADVPTISQTRNLLMLEAPKQHELCYHIKPLPPIPPSSAARDDAGKVRASSAPAAKTQDMKDDARGGHDALRSPDVHRQTKTEGEPSCVDEASFFTPRQNVPSPEERVFLTQADDAENEEVLFFNHDQPKTNDEKEEAPVPENVPQPASIAKKYKGYEDLLKIDENYPEDIELPRSIYGNVRALQYALDHPLTFTQQSARYRNERPSKYNQRMQAWSRFKNTRPTTVEELGSILDKMRTQTRTVESNLGHVLKGHKRQQHKREFKEAKRLLNEVQTKYDEVRCESLRSTAVAADLLKKPAVSTPLTPLAPVRTERDMLLSRGKSREVRAMLSDNGATTNLSQGLKKL